jgi:hypothetical protein
MHAALAAELPKRMQHLAGRMSLEPAALLANRPLQLQARFEDVYQHMHTGDGLWYAGTSLNSWLIRISDYANVSHGGVILRDGDRIKQIRLMDVIESWAWKKGGGRDLSLWDEVKSAPGYWIWGPVADPYLEADPATGHVRFNRSEAERAARELIGCTYGWRGIGLMALTRLPVAREIAYAVGRRDIDTPWQDQPPFCSWAQSIIATRAGVDPVPERAPQLTSPANTYQSLLWGQKIILV